MMAIKTGKPFERNQSSFYAWAFGILALLVVVLYFLVGFKAFGKSGVRGPRGIPGPAGINGQRCP
jgi:hypothetical protein